MLLSATCARAKVVLGASLVKQYFASCAVETGTEVF